PRCSKPAETPHPTIRGALNTWRWSCSCGAAVTPPATIVATAVAASAVERSDDQRAAETQHVADFAGLRISAQPRSGERRSATGLSRGQAGGARHHYGVGRERQRSKVKQVMGVFL